MKVLYLTDDRSNYCQGFYYVDWIKVFEQQHDVQLWGPGYEEPSAEAVRGADLVIVGHGALDVLRKSQPRYAFAPRRWWQVRRRLRRQRCGYWDLDLRRIKNPKVLLSKNDYKILRWKTIFARNERIDLVITHSLQALPQFRAAGLDAEWIPFGVDRTMFKVGSATKDIDIGFRGNLHDKWTCGLRRRLMEAVQRECSDLRLDIEGSTLGENFLAGDTYAKWLSRCHLFLNTVSAIGTVGPKWWEAMACGCVPLGPVDEYEGLLTPDVHYLAVRQDLSDLRKKVDRFFQDQAFRTQLIAGISEMAKQADMTNRYRQLWDVFRQRGLV